jgi:branched-chain amino acid transport system ATP-binding protein
MISKSVERFSDRIMRQVKNIERASDAKQSHRALMPESDALLSLAAVETHIGPYHILHGVDLAVPRGGLTMLLGRNGAGKTTTLRTIMGLWRASAGEVVFDGEAITGRPTPAIAQSGIDAQRLRWVFGLFPALQTFWALRAGSLSGGQKQMLSIARAIIEPRKLLLVDEPTKGLAPSIIVNMVAAFRELKGDKTTILLVEQNFAVAEALGDTVAVMDDGRVVHRGPMAELAGDRDLQQRLLGLSLDRHQ